MIEISDPRLGIRDSNDIGDPKFAPYLLKDRQICRRQNYGSIIRIFRGMLGNSYKVQRIVNPGVLDRRRKRASRERREILLITKDRAAAVAFFNKLIDQESNKLEKTVKISAQFNTTPESAVINQMMTCLQNLQRSAPLYFAELEDANLDIAPLPILVDLMARAPTEEMRFYIFGKLSVRVALASITGRQFE